MSGFDLLVKNGTILTVDKELSRKRWFAVKDGKIAAMGERDDFAGEAKEVIDLNGDTVMPGFVDAHVHGTLQGMSHYGMDLLGINTVAGIVDAVREVCAKDPSDKVVYGYNMTMAKDLEDRRAPSRTELDAVTGDHPAIILNWTIHGGIINTKAIEYLKATAPDVAKLVNEQGYFNEDDPIAHILGLFTDEDFETFYIRLCEDCAKEGITTVHSLDGFWVKDDRDTDVLMRIIDTLPIEIRPYTQTFDVEKVYNYGLRQIGGCLPVDGSPPQMTAAFSEPYNMAPHTRGLLRYSDKELYGLISEASKRGMQCIFHTIGDRAIDQVMYIYQQVDREIGIRHLRHRIEHMSYPSPRCQEMAAEMGIVAVCQPTLANFLDRPDRNIIEFQLPKEKCIWQENFRIRMEAGITVANGSDAPAASLRTLDALNACVNMHNPERRISLDDAMKLCTINAAYAGHQEDRIGSLEEGKQADFIILDKDPYALPAGSDLSKLTVKATYKKGNCVFRNAESSVEAPSKDPHYC